jgi:hypothetical protein
MSFPLRRSLQLLLLTGLIHFASAETVLRADNGRQWYKGNTHTHTLWSDGDAAPEVSVSWYKKHGYDFLCLSDHNVLSDGSVEKWQPIGGKGYLTEERVAAIEKEFGEGWVTRGIRDGTPYMKLKTLPEIKECFEEPGRFLLIQAEEVTSYFPSVHVGALNLQRVIPPVNSTSQAEALAAALANLNEQSEKFGIPMLAHLNHPNFAEGVTVESMLEVDTLRFFEVYNGHPSVLNWGSEEKHRPDTDRMWDIALAQRLRHGKKIPLYGLATDDTHDYFVMKVGEANAGRGWVQVLAETLDTDSILEAMKRGDFYSSTGVELGEIGWDDRSMRLSIKGEEGIEYTTRFIGTRKGFDPSSEPVLDEEGKEIPDTNRKYSKQIGEVLLETSENPAVYPYKGDELYVRAKIVSDKEQENPFAEGDVEMAWTQPIVRE